MLKKLALLGFFISVIGITGYAQKSTCQSLHNGKYKIYSKESGTTLIERNGKIQVEKNEAAGVEMVFEIKWVDECTYELRPKKLIKGPPELMGDGTYVIRTVIKDITDDAYTAVSTANFFSGEMEFVVEIIH